MQSKLKYERRETWTKKTSCCVPLGRRYVSDCITMVTYVMKCIWIAYLTWYNNVQYQCWQRIITYIRKLLHKNDFVKQIILLAIEWSCYCE